MIAWYRATPISFPGWRPPRITVPTLMLWGEGDRFLTRAVGEESAALCDRGRIEIFPGATHWIHHEQFSAVRDRMREFLTA
jgi:pimeloyl-ACP methyl ester carboxylesterase